MAKTPTERILENLGTDPDTLLPLGEKSAQEIQGAIYSPLPQPAARNEGIEQGHEVEIFYHPPTGGFITIPTDK